MAIGKINTLQLIEECKDALILDVRSEGEFAQAHFPGAISFPIFTDEERKKVGAAYKQESRVIAVNIGLKIFREKMSSLLKAAEILREENGKSRFVIYCWRGGLRSNTMAWLLQLYGTPVAVLHGGYKSFRRWSLQQFEKEYSCAIIGGYTGSAKTEVIQELKKCGAKAIDLEGIAHHKGSAFGHINMPLQNRQEHFENLLALALFEQNKKDGVLYLEDESQRIGKNLIPNTLWKKMRESVIYFLEIPFEERLKHIVDEYGVFDVDALKKATENIKKNLGGLATKNVLVHLENHEIEEGFKILLQYYDKYYQKGLEKREDWQQLKKSINTPTTDANMNAKKILGLSK